MIMARIMSHNQNCRVMNLLILFLLSHSLLHLAAGQPSDSSRSDDEYNLDPSHVSPSYEVIVIVIVMVFFITGFISLYIHQCTDNTSTVDANPVSRTPNVRGIDKSLIETFPTFLYSEVKQSKLGERSLECAICLNEFEEDDTLRLLPRCDHVFHSQCIDAWLAGHSTCPVCRANLAVDPIQIGTLAESTQQNAEEESPSEVRIDIGTEEGNPKTNRKLPRSHSTGHSLSRPEDSERFTLKLPAEVRRQLLARTKLKRATSLLALPRASSSRRGYKGEGSGSSRYGRMLGRSISRVVSFKWPVKARGDGEGSTKRGFSTAVTPLDDFSSLSV